MPHYESTWQHDNIKLVASEVATSQSLQVVSKPSQENLPIRADRIDNMLSYPIYEVFNLILQSWKLLLLLLLKTLYVPQRAFQHTITICI